MSFALYLRWKINGEYLDSQELAKALKAADAKVQDKIFRNMTESAAGMLKEDMEYLGPIRLEEAERSQHTIVAVIRHMEDTGKIVIPRAIEKKLASPQLPC